jgi:Uma2 family endonuclease
VSLRYETLTLPPAGSAETDFRDKAGNTRGFHQVHECPSHDLAGWRRERLPDPPDGVIDLPPDWVCEIVSPGHEKKDTVTIPLLLQRHRVPWFWLIWPEARALIAHALEGDGYRAIATLNAAEHRRVRVPPFDAPLL